MKKLSNVSPFLLLLFPVLIMMVFTFVSATTATQNDDEVALKSSSSKTALIKISNPFNN
ncbi:hypothetical protein ACVWYN_000620 [Pedobacter sp. UYP24]